MVPADQPEKAVRRKIGKYAVVGRIGRGGMGMVYRGWDEVLEREVAVKTLTAEGTQDEESRQRFQIEARAAARLQHANIVTVFELGEDRGLPYIAMELLPGVDLESLVRAGDPLLLEEKLEIMAQVLRGLHFAHEHGIVHRDIKPSNIRLLEDGTAKIMDFGIAKLGATGVTKTGMMLGTVHYMSPEQIRGQPLDGRSDVFSSGVILYELLAGRRPFVGDSATVVLYKIISDPHPGLDPAVAGTAPDLQAILDRALAKDPADRYATAALMAEEVAAVAARLRGPTAAPPPDVVEAVSLSRRLLKEGRLDDAVRRLEDTAGRHPRSLEARRALRMATRERDRRQKPRDPEAEDFPELDLTYQPAPTRRTAETVLQPVPAARVDTGATAATSTPLPPASGSTLPWVAGGVLLVALAAGAFLVLRGRDPAAAVSAGVRVRSDPPGARVFLDGRDIGVSTNATVTLPGQSGTVTLLLRKRDYRDVSRVLRLPLDGTELRFTLEPVPVVSSQSLPIVTEPAGASVTLDGEAVAGTTPLTVSIDPGQEHRIGFRLEGHASQEIRLAAGSAPPQLRATLERTGPQGRVTVAGPYPFDVVWQGKVLSRGQASAQVTVPAGRQVLTLIAPTYFLRQNVTIDVRPPAPASVNAPPLGKIHIRANPDNCQVFIDGEFAEYPPILDRAIAAGEHRVAFKWSDGTRHEETVDVSATAPAYVMGRKERSR
jgi:serine/threonine protein kinase